MCCPDWTTTVKQSRGTLETLARKRGMRGRWVLSAATPAAGESRVRVCVYVRTCVRENCLGLVSKGCLEICRCASMLQVSSILVYILNFLFFL